MYKTKKLDLLVNTKNENESLQPRNICSSLQYLAAIRHCTETLVTPDCPECNTTFAVSRESSTSFPSLH